MKVTRDLVREAAVINLLEFTPEGSTLLDKIKTELWCLREGIETTEHPEIWDITLGEHTTTDLIQVVLYGGSRDKHDQAAMLLCTMQELS